MPEQALVWERSLDDLADSIDAYAAKLEVAALAGAKVLAEQLEEEAKNNASWQDQTGDARAGLYAFAVQAAGLITIYLAHGDEITYDLILELGHGGKYAIIAPTLEAALPRVYEVIREQLQ